MTSTSGKFAMGTRASHENQHLTAYVHSPRTPRGLPDRHSRKFLELPDSELKARPWRRPCPKLVSKRWNRNEYPGKRENAHIARESMTSNGSQVPGISKKEIQDRLALIRQSEHLAWTHSTDSESSEVELETLPLTSPRRNLSFKIPSGKAKEEGRLRCIRPSATRTMATTPNTCCIHLDNLVRLETKKHHHVQDADSEGNLNDGPSSGMTFRDSKLQEFVIRRYHNVPRAIPRTPLQEDPN